VHLGAPHRSCTLVRGVPIRMRSHLQLLGLLLAAASLAAQSQTTDAPDPAHRPWTASWITHPTAPLREPLVLHFRRTLELDALPERYIVRVSADNRFLLFVNGKRVGDGPARGDLAHWRYERFDLAPYLRPGSNLITATVWNFAIYAPLAQVSDRTAFLLESQAAGSASISTPQGWQVEEDPGIRPIRRPVNGFSAYMAAGFGEEFDASRTDWNSSDPANDSTAWLPAASPIRESIYPNSGAAHSAGTDSANAWELTPDLLPPMEYTDTSAGNIVRVQIGSDAGFLTGMEGTGLRRDDPRWRYPGFQFTIDPMTHYNLLLDRETLTTAYPELTVSGGKGARIRFTYAEALFDKHQHKGDRDAVAGRTALGIYDEFLPDGGQHRIFAPLWWRTWRYLDIDIETAAAPLTLESLTAHFTAYPFQERARFHSPDPDLEKIWQTSWRTARLDAHETYMDTPYYEQLQYVGDTRVQALISYTVAGDDRLARQAIAAFDQSRTPEGLTLSRYPSSLPQSIPTFSLIWVGMVHDYWLYRPDPEPARATLPGIRAVLGWFAQYREPKGILHEFPGWSFVDWVSSGTIPTYSKSGLSCVTSLHYLGALADAAELENALGDPFLAERDRGQAESLRTEINRLCWSEERALLADNPDKTTFSQQANLLGVLYDAIPKERQREVLTHLLKIEPGTTPEGILSASYYFRFYLARALDHAGMADAYLDSLAPWRALLPLHFSTWPETPGETRSDSHAWTAHPIYDLLTLVAGIEPATPGFASVRIAPHLGSLPSLRASFPHPAGEIQVNYQRAGDNLEATITLPGKLSGSFVWKGKTWPLHPGVNRLQAR